MADIVEIIIVARDLATGKLDQTTRKLEGSLGRMRTEAAATSKSFDELSTSTEQLGQRSARATRDLDTVTTELTKVEKAMHGVGSASEGRSRELERFAASLRSERNELRLAERDAGSFTNALGRLGSAIRRNIADHVGMTRAFHDAETGAVRFETSVRNLTRGVERALPSFTRFNRAADAAARGVGNFTRAFIDGDRKLTKFTSTSQRAGNAFGLMLRSLTSINFMFIAILGGLSLLPGALAGVTGGVFALTGGIVALTAALSSLSGLAVALPAAFAGLAGTIAAVVTILKPATSGILAFVSAADKAKQQTGGGTGASGGQSTAAAVSDARRNLRDTQRVNNLQEKRLESELAQARIDAVRRVKEAEQNLAQTRESVFRRLIDLERQLVTLRTDNDQQRAQLEQSVASAQEKARIEAAKPGGGRSVLAQALVGEARADLSKFNRDAASSEGDLVSQIVQEREQGIAQIKKAEQDLIQTRADGVRHIRDLELSLKQTRIQNAQQEAAATKAIQQARQGPASAAGAIDAAKAAYARLSPLQQKIANQILDIKKRWADLTKVFQNRFLREVSKDLDLVGRNLDKIAKRVGAFADAITNTIKKARLAFQDATFTDALDVGVQDAARNVEKFGTVLVNLGKTITIVVAQAKPLLDFITDSILGWSKYIEAATKVDAANGDLSTFFEHTRQTLTVVVDIVKNFGIALFNIGKIGRGFGQDLLDSLDKVSRKFREFTDSAKGKNEIKSFFKDALPVVHEIFDIVKDLAKRLGVFGRDAIRGGEKSPFVKTLKVVKTILDNVLTAIGNIGKGLGGGTLKGLKDLSDLLAQISTHTAALNILLGLADALIRLTKFLTGGNDPISKGLANILTAIVVLSIAFPKLGELFITKVVFPIIAGIATMIAGLIGFDAVMVGSTLIVSAFGITVDIALGPVLLILAALALLYIALTHWDTVKRLVREFFGFLVNLLSKAWDLIKRGVSATWDWIKDKIPGVWHAIVNFFENTAPGLLLRALGAIWSALKGAVSTVWDAIKGLIVDAWHGIVHFFTDTAPGLLKKAFSGIWDGIKDVTKKALQGIVDGIYAFFVKGPIRAINFVVEHAHIPGIPHIPSPEPPKLQFLDEGGVVQPGPGQRRGDPKLVVAHVGETFVPTHKDTLRGFGTGAAKGGGNVASDSLGKVGDVLGAGAGFLVHQLERLFPHLPEFPGVIGDVASGILHLIKDKILDWGKDKLESALGNIFGQGGSSGGAVTPQVLRGLHVSGAIDEGNQFQGINWGHEPQSAALHVYPGGVPPWNRRLSGAQANLVANLALGVAGAQATIANVTALLGRAQQESGLQSGVINQWDSNWLAGIPSMGFLQTVGGTFNAHVVQPFTNIWDPLHNAIAAVRYMLANYHHIVGPSGTGYDVGGIIGSDVVGKTSGGKRDGAPINILAHVGEWILNREQQMRLANALGGWEKAKSLLFSTPQPQFGTSFALGGVVGGSSTLNTARTANVQVGPIYTTSPQIDIDYIAALADRRLSEMG